MKKRLLGAEKELTGEGVFAIIIKSEWDRSEKAELEIRVDASLHFSISNEETSKFDVLTGFLTCLNNAFSNNILALNF